MLHPFVYPLLPFCRTTQRSHTDFYVMKLLTRRIINNSFIISILKKFEIWFEIKFSFINNTLKISLFLYALIVRSLVRQRFLLPCRSVRPGAVQGYSALQFASAAVCFSISEIFCCCFYLILFLTNPEFLIKTASTFLITLKIAIYIQWNQHQPKWV